MTAEKSPIRWGHILYLLLVGLAFLWLLMVLSMAFGANFGKPLNQDIPEFIQGAMGSTYFYDSGLREPLHVFCLKIGLYFFPDHEQAARLTTVGQTIFAALAMWYFAKTVFGSAVALLSLWFFVVNPVVIFYGVSGMRASLYMGLLMIFAAQVWQMISRDRARTRDMIITGVIGGLLILTRRYSAAIILLGLGVGFGVLWQFKRQRCLQFGKAAAGVGVIATLILVPDLLFHETPVFRDNINFFRNLEFYGHAGAFRESPPVSFLHYVFVDHTLGEVITIISKNIFFFPSDYLSFFFRYLPYFWFFAWLATLSIWKSPAFAWVSLMAWLSLAPIVFVLHLNQVEFGVGVENRLVIQTFALFLPAMIAFALTVIEKSLRWVMTSAPQQDIVDKWCQKMELGYWDTF